MANPLSLEALMELRGSPVVDRIGDEVGLLQDVYYDRDTRLPEWIAVSTDFYGNRLLVPVTQAEATGGALRVPYDKNTIRSTPSFDDREIDESKERDLYRHYGITYSQRASSTVLPDAVDVNSTDTSTIATNPDMTARWSTVEERTSARTPVPGSHASKLEAASAGLSPETAAPFPTVEPEAATAPENARPAPRRDAPGPPRFDPHMEEKQALADAPIVMTDMPADVPGTLYDTTPSASRKRPRTGGTVVSVIVTACAGAAGLLLVRRIRTRRSKAD